LEVGVAVMSWGRGPASPLPSSLLKEPPHPRMRDGRLRFSHVALPSNRWDRIALAALLVGAVARAVWVFVLHQPFDHVYSDMDEYVTKAKRLATGDGLNPFDAFHSPGTQFLLAVPFRIFGTGHAGEWAAAVLWWGLSSLTPLFAWRLGLVLLTRPAAALTALFAALWPLHVTVAGFFSSETPATALLTGGVWLSVRALKAHPADRLTQGLCAGVVLGSAAAVRAQFLLNLGIVALMYLRGARTRLVTIAAATVGVAVVFAGVVVHNSLAMGNLTGLDTHGGQAFFIGHCDVRKLTTRKDGFHYVFGPPPAAQRQAGRTYEFNGHQPWEQWFFYGQGFHCVNEDGVAHLGLVARGIADMTALTQPWPMSNEPVLRVVVTSTNFLYSVALPLIIVAALLGASRAPRGLRRSGEILLLANLACVFVVGALWALGEPRYRLPYDVFGLALLAAVLSRRMGGGGREPAGTD
jgi:4-amino-4-deoxy-L-arabinose transferase-like glycosyltransferase